MQNRTALLAHHDVHWADEYIERGIARQHAQDYEESIDLLNQAYSYYKNKLSSFKASYSLPHQSLFSNSAQSCEKKIARITFYLGLGYSFLSKHELAVDHLEESRAIAEKLNNAELIGLANLHLGISFSKLNNHHHALQAFDIARTFFDKDDNQNHHAISLYYLGQTHNALGQYEQALSCLNEAKHLFLSVNDLEKFYECVLEMGISQLKIGHFNQAIYLLESLDYTKTPAVEQADVEQLLGIGYLNIDRPRQAIEHLKNALKEHDRLNNTPANAVTHIALGICYTLTAKHHDAKNHFKSALNFLRTSTDNNEILLAIPSVLHDLLSTKFIELANTTGIAEFQSLISMYQQMQEISAPKQETSGTAYSSPKI